MEDSQPAFATSSELGRFLQKGSFHYSQAPTCRPQHLFPSVISPSSSLPHLRSLGVFEFPSCLSRSHLCKQFSTNKIWLRKEYIHHASLSSSKVNSYRNRRTCPGVLRCELNAPSPVFAKGPNNVLWKPEAFWGVCVFVCCFFFMPAKCFLIGLAIFSHTPSPLALHVFYFLCTFFSVLPSFT